MQPGPNISKQAAAQRGVYATQGATHIVYLRYSDQHSTIAFLPKLLRRAQRRSHLQFHSQRGKPALFVPLSL